MIRERPDYMKVVLPRRIRLDDGKVVLVDGSQNILSIEHLMQHLSLDILEEFYSKEEEDINEPLLRLKIDALNALGRTK